jgi:hypothetical protein
MDGQALTGAKGRSDSVRREAKGVKDMKDMKDIR